MAATYERIRRRRQLAKAAGLCITCCKGEPEAPFSVCVDCRTSARLRVEKRRAAEREGKSIKKLGSSLEAAGDAAVAQCLFPEAAKFYEQALAANLEIFDRTRLVEKLTQALFLSDRPDAATRLLDDVMSQFHTVDETDDKAVRLLLNMGRQLWMECKTEAATALVKRAVAIATHAANEPLRQTAILNMANMLNVVGDFAEAEKYLRLLRHVIDNADIEMRCRYFNQAAIVAASKGRSTAAFADFEQAIACSLRSNRPYFCNVALDDYAHWLSLLGCKDRAMGCYERLLEHALEHHLGWRIPYARLHFAQFLLKRGNHARAEALFEEACEYEASAPRLHLLLTVVAIDLAIQSGKPVNSKWRPHRSMIELTFKSGEAPLISSTVACFARHYTGENKVGKARAILRRATQCIAPHFGCWDLLIEAAELQALSPVECEYLLASAPFSGTKAEAVASRLLVKAYIARARHQDPYAFANAAAEAFGRMGWRHYTARALGVANPTAVNDGRGNVAFGTWTATVKKRLTDRERDVAELIGAGCTNRQISRHLSISEHTVESHVSSILSRLGLRSRWQLGDMIDGTSDHLVNRAER